MGEELYELGSRKAWIDKLPPSQGRLADMLGQELDALLELREVSEKHLDEEAKEHPIVKRLATAPGIGPIRAAQIVAVVITPHRFRTKRQFWSYCGLAIVTRSSADWIREGKRWIRAEVAKTRGLNRNRQPLLKSVFKGAALTVTQMSEHPLCQNYRQMLDAGTKPNLAMLTTARRIAAAILAMWKQQEVYDPAKHRRQTA